MKIMSSSKEPAEGQQSYFYVVWPEEKSTASSIAASAAASAVTNSIPSASSSDLPMPTFSYESQALISSSSTNDTSTIDLHREEPPVVSPQRSPLIEEETGSVASVQVMTSNTLRSPCRSTADENSSQSSSLQHVTAAVPCNVAAFPSLDSYNANSSVRRHKTVVTPEYSPAKPKFHRGAAGNSVGDRESNMREIGHLFADTNYIISDHPFYAGTLAKQAILNLQKIMLVTGSAASPAIPDLPASKRRRICVSHFLTLLSELKHCIGAGRLLKLHGM